MTAARTLLPATLLATLLGVGASGLSAQEERPAFPWRLVPERAILGHLFDGYFMQPSAVCYDTWADEVLVADRRAGRIGIYDPDGVPLFSFGDVVEPYDIHTDPDGNILVLGQDRSQLYRYSYRGEVLAPLRFVLPDQDLSVGEGEGEAAVRIVAFTVDAEGQYYVADEVDPQVLIYHPDLTLRTRIRPARAAAQFKRITGLDVASDGKIAVIDVEATPVQVFSPSGRFLHGFGDRGSGARSFSVPTDVAFDGVGHLYVVDMPKHHVKVFTVEGRLETIFGGRFGPGTGGRMPGEMRFPVSVSVQPDGYVYVAERYGARIQIFRREPEEER